MERVHALAKQAARMEERRRLARDLHDRIGSQLTRLVIGEEAVPAAGAAQGSRAALASQALHDLDEVVWLTNPAKDTLQHTVEYLGRQMREFLEGTNIRFRLDVPLEIPAAPLTAAVRHQLLRIFEEGLTNVLKHARATEVVLALGVDRERVTLALRDNGCGFSETSHAQHRNGLTNMRERAREAGAKLEVQSPTGRGTTLSVHLPLLQ
jgi:signal transduction histidine kinase